MKKLNKLLALCLALTMLLLCVPFTASAAETTYGPENIQEIPGIDYNRITQKATGGGKSYPVELKMGDLTFNGELTGSNGLTYEELNKIINEVLKEKNLTADRIALVAKLAGRVETDAALYWGDQIIQGLLSFIPTPPGSPGGVNDYYAYIVHGEGKGVDSMVAESAVNTIVTAAEIKLNPSTGKYFSKIPFAATTGTDKVPLLGQLVNTFKVGKEWLEGNKQLEKYLDLLEKNLADINGFYSECSRRANKLAEEKGVWTISINDQQVVDYGFYVGSVSFNAPMIVSADIELVKDDGSYGNIGGAYIGSFKINADTDFTEFEKSYHHMLAEKRNSAAGSNTLTIGGGTVWSGTSVTVNRPSEMKFVLESTETSVNLALPEGVNRTVFELPLDTNVLDATYSYVIDIVGEIQRRESCRGTTTHAETYIADDDGETAREYLIHYDAHSGCMDGGHHYSRYSDPSDETRASQDIRNYIKLTLVVDMLG